MIRALSAVAEAAARASIELRNVQATTAQASGNDDYRN